MADTPKVPPQFREQVDAMHSHIGRFYPERSSKAAVRCALGDASVLCEMMAEKVRKANPGRRKGEASQVGEAMADVAERLASLLWAMREEVEVPHD